MVEQWREVSRLAWLRGFLNRVFPTVVSDDELSSRLPVQPSRHSIDPGSVSSMLNSRDLDKEQVIGCSAAPSRALGSPSTPHERWIFDEDANFRLARNGETNDTLVPRAYG